MSKVRGGREAPKVQVVQTGDGSCTLLHEEHGVHYRSCFGAFSESRYVFLEGCRLPEKSEKWTVLELGFGGAVNFVLTAQAAVEEGVDLDYHTIDWSPVGVDDLIQLHRHFDTALQPYAEMAQQVSLQACHSDGICRVEDVSLGVRLSLYPSHWSKAEVPKDLEADALYHDPFGPAVNAEAWELPCLEWMTKHMAKDGILSTYGAASRTKAALVASGLWVASRPGFGKKREVTIASRTKSHLFEGKLLSRARYWNKARELWPDRVAESMVDGDGARDGF